MRRRVGNTRREAATCDGVKQITASPRAATICRKVGTTHCSTTTYDGVSNNENNTNISNKHIYKT